MFPVRKHFPSKVTSFKINVLAVAYLTDILLLLFAESKLDEDLLELLIAVVDNELFKTVVLQEQKDG